MQTKACSRNGIHGLYLFNIEGSRPSNMFWESWKIQIYIFLIARALTQIERSSHDTRDLNPYGGHSDSRSCSGKTESITIRKGKRDIRTKLTEDASISQALLDSTWECVELMQKEVAGLCDRLQRTSQEAKEKLQQEKLQQENPAGSGSGMSHK